MNINADEEGRNLQVWLLVELKHWARPLGIPARKIAYHVLEAPDLAAAIIEFARSNHVDQIVIGSRGSSTFRYLGSVSSQVVARANCTVTVVKAEETAVIRASTRRRRSARLVSIQAAAPAETSHSFI